MIAPSDLCLRQRVIAQVVRTHGIQRVPGVIVGRTIEANPLYDVLLDGTREIAQRLPRTSLCSIENSEENNGR